MKKKVLSALLAMTLLFSMAPAAYAAEPADSNQTETGETQTEAVAQIGDQTYPTLADAIEAAKTNETTIVLLQDITEDVTIPVGANITIDGQKSAENNGFTLYGGITCKADASDKSNDSAPSTTLTLQNLNMDGKVGENDSIIYGISSGNQTASGQMDLYLTMNNCTMQNFVGKGMYLTNAKELNIDNCTFANNATNGKILNGQGDFTIDLNLCAVQDALVSITNSKFDGNYGITAAIKVAARGGNNDESDVQKAPLATVKNVSIENCQFSKGHVLAKTIKFGTKAKDFTGAFPFELKNNTRVDDNGAPLPVTVNLDYRENDKTVNIDSNGTLVKPANGDVGSEVARVGNIHYASLQSAINTAQDGDTVTVIGDASKENVLVSDKAINIVGEADSKVGTISVINNTAKDATFENLTFVGASNEKNKDTNCSALYVQNMNNVSVKDCTFDLASQLPEDTNTFAIVSANPTNNIVVENCTIDGYTGAGYINPGTEKATFTGNTIQNIPSGIAFIGTPTVVVENNTFDNANGVRLEPDWNTPANVCGDVTISGNKFLSMNESAASQYAVRPTNSNGDAGYDTDKTLNLSHNYWGSANPDFDKLIPGSDKAGITVNAEPYYVQPTMQPEDLNTYEPPYTGKYSYEIFTKVGDNGTLDVEQYATEGDEVTFTITPDEAYMLDEMTITSDGKDVDVTDNGDGTYTFTMPSGDVKINVTFTEDPDWEPTPDMPFTDVNENDWFYGPVQYVFEQGLMTGTSADQFSPSLTTTRGMIVSILHRLEGGPTADAAGFTDVSADAWYADAVNWAASVGVVNGMSDTTFAPNDPITREQMAAILFNYATYKGYDTSARADLSGYEDSAQISSWALEALQWANAEGLVNGDTATTINAQGNATRAEVATILMRFCETIAK